MSPSKAAPPALAVPAMNSKPLAPKNLPLPKPATTLSSSENALTDGSVSKIPASLKVMEPCFVVTTSSPE
jgi:hypothetical protein